MTEDDRWLGSRPVAGEARKPIGEVLVDQGLITAEQLAALLAEQERPGSQRPRLGAAVVNAGYASDRQVAEALATALNLRGRRPFAGNGQHRRRPAAAAGGR